MSRRVTVLIPLLLLLAVVLYVFSPLVADPDLWGHVRFGRDTLLTGRIIRADTYSYLTAGQPWINHEWLSEVLYGLAYNAAGAAGLAALNLLLVLGIAGLVYGRLVKAQMARFGALLLTAGLCLVLRPAALNVRPQVFTYLLFLILLLSLEGAARRWDAAKQGAGRVDLAFVAGVCALFALWINLHGGVLAGIGVLYLWGAAYLAQQALAGRSLRVLGQPRCRTAIVAMLVAPAALLLNPYGPGLIGFLLRTATVARPEILEWHGVRLTDVWSWYWLVTVVLTLAAVALSRRPRRPSTLLPLAVVALLPLSAIRHIPLAALAAPALAAEHFADLWERLPRPRTRDLSGLGSSRTRDLTGLALALMLLALAVPRVGKIVIDPVSVSFPVRAVAFLQSTGVRGNMATEFNWGEYVLWHVGPGVKVSVDGRRETVYAEGVYRENLDFMQGQGRWDRLVDRGETDLALVDRHRPAYDLMRSKAGWQLAYEDATAALFVRAGARLAPGAWPVPADWPADGAELAFPVE